jgi:methionine--tRNA ligase beta chain
MDQINFTDFEKVEMRVGQIVESEKVEGSEKMLRFGVDFGPMGRKSVFSGIGKWFEPEEFINKKTAFVVNITPKKIMGQDSEAMILAADETASGKPGLIFFDEEVINGTRII